MGVVQRRKGIGREKGASPGLSGKESTFQCRRAFDPWVGKIRWRRKWQYSCLGNLMDRGVWPATAHVPAFATVPLESFLGRQVMLVVKNLPANAGDMRDIGLIPGLGRAPGGGHETLIPGSP